MRVDALGGAAHHFQTTRRTVGFWPPLAVNASAVKTISRLIKRRVFLALGKTLVLPQALACLAGEGSWK